MFSAKSKRTGEIVNSLNLVNNIRYQMPDEDDWIADPSQIDNWEEIKEKYSEIKVVYIREKKFINYNGRDVFVQCHFRIPNAKKLGINFVPESKEHKLAKNWMYNRLINDDFLLYYSDVNKPYRYVNTIKLSELPIDKDKTTTEALIKDRDSRIVDIICPFLITHPLLGNGICFEIQFSYQREKTQKDRTIDIALRGYSVCWLHISDFEKLSELLIELKKNTIKIDSWLSIVSEKRTDIVKNIKYAVQEQIMMIDKEKKNILKYMKINGEDIFLGFKKQVDDYVSLRYREMSDILESRYREIMNGVIERSAKIYESYKNKIDNPPPIINKTYQTIEISRPICKECGSQMILKDGKYGKFWSCSEYPKCQYHMKADVVLNGNN